MGSNTNPRIEFRCDYCGGLSTDKPSHYARKNRHFCNRQCYSKYRKYFLPREEQHRYGTGTDDEETKRMKRKARSDLNHAIRDGLVQRKPCEICKDNNSEGHHENYKDPLNVKWLCFKHHRMTHENPELMEVVK